MISYKSIRLQLRVLKAVFLHEISRIGGRAGIGFLFVLAEPVLHLSLIATYHWLMRVKPIYGTSKVLFLASGLYPVFVFIHVASHGRIAAKQGDGSSTFPIINSLDSVVAECVLKFFAESVAGVILFFGIYVFVTPQGEPTNLVAAIGAVSAFGLMGVAVSLINVGVEALFPPWRLLFGPSIRALAMFSGVLFVPDYYLPIPVRSIMDWNPLMHGITLFRLGFYPRYPTLLFSSSYLWGCTLVLLVVGLTLERVTRRSFKRAHDEIPSWLEMLGA